MSQPLRVRRRRGRRLSAAVLTAVALTALPGGASAAPQPAGAAVQAANRLDITMQAQEKTNWCWAASGNTIATWYGKSYSQNQFCNAAFNRQQNSTCPNNQATLGNVQNALDWMGVNPGSYVTGWLRYTTVQSEINAKRPVETRIQWSSGGGHMHVIYGYDASRNWVYWGDPWATNNRYNWGDFDNYVNGSSFSWTHSLYRIGA
ncbi:C39 family peptidase [Streptomyces albulus]|uniref:papain-like cysteine protease family protein n=1 Tax=Streptomyces noursei TaxID=1971 RepID=UPI001F1749A2|nr:papain-like cysteine protease family protein [Streptomyces noursei]MCE4944597.1 C39 family peptidase [Streptomyces noursei]